MTTVRLQSIKSEERKGEGGKSFLTMCVFTPGLIRWAKAGFAPSNPALAHDLAASFGLKPEVMVALLTGEVDYQVEGDDVVFNWPGDNPNVEEKK